MTSLRAVIFDLDGCLVDSEPMSLSVLAQEMAKHGLTVSDADMRRRYLGMSLSSISAELAARTGRAVPPDFAQMFEERLLVRYPGELRQIDGALALVDGLIARGVAVAIATGGSLRRMALTLQISGLARLFEGRAFSADQVARGKPAPDLFLLAARNLGIDPALCAVIEDSPHGITGARAAGMRALGFTGGSHLDLMRPEHAARLTEAGAETVASDLSEIAAALHAPIAQPTLR